ncbi:unnamed protein product [Strongylus vulgaris]|uniref:Major facilitator superfamily (MFS) profile domain-containing protein n=1 Tax=Strongylus vulgaris TaxID=40348 RepID=A0A3P7IS89_STRVU|nr:unnamed protein product [Strongylus vulgaris]
MGWSYKRKADDRWTLRTLECEAKRPRGRPPTRWADVFVARMDQLNSQLVKSNGWTSQTSWPQFNTNIVNDASQEGNGKRMETRPAREVKTGHLTKLGKWKWISIKFRALYAQRRGGADLNANYILTGYILVVINAYAVEILRGTGLTSLQASLANIAIALVSMHNALGFILIFVICLFIIFFAIGPGPLCYFINAELVGQAARSGAQSWASVVQMLSRFVIVTIFLPMRNTIGDSWSYLILFVAPVAVSILFLYFKLPETKNKTPIEVEAAMDKLPTIYSIRSRGKVSCVSTKC